MHVPRAVCARCNEEMHPVKNGVTLEMVVGAEKEPYYKIDADKWGCSRCNAQVYVAFAKEARAEAFQRGYLHVPVEAQVVLR